MTHIRLGSQPSIPQCLQGMLIWYEKSGCNKLSPQDKENPKVPQGKIHSGVKEILQACRQLQIHPPELCSVPCLDKTLFNDSCTMEDCPFTPEIPFPALPQPKMRMKWCLSLSAVKVILLSQPCVCQMIPNTPSHPTYHLHNLRTTHRLSLWTWHSKTVQLRRCPDLTWEEGSSSWIKLILHSPSPFQ